MSLISVVSPIMSGVIGIMGVVLGQRISSRNSELKLMQSYRPVIKISEEKNLNDNLKKIEFLTNANHLAYTDIYMFANRFSRNEISENSKFKKISMYDVKDSFSFPFYEKNDDTDKNCFLITGFTDYGEKIAIFWSFGDTPLYFFKDDKLTDIKNHGRSFRHYRDWNKRFFLGFEWNTKQKSKFYSFLKSFRDEEYVKRI